MSDRPNEMGRTSSAQPPVGQSTATIAYGARSRPDEFWNRFLWVLLYALAMAWVEAAVVLDLRTLAGQMNPYPPQPVPGPPIVERAELVREAATLLMLGSVGWLAGRTWRSRLAYALVAFGVWDVCYYLFLKILTGWPNSCLDWDILFLLPLPWWGPVLAPVLIALLMISGGALVARFDSSARPFWPKPRSLALNFCGGALALYVFMADAICAFGQGIQALKDILPVSFNWPLFVVALGLMAVPVVELAARARRQPASAEPGGLRSSPPRHPSISSTVNPGTPSL